MKAPSTAVSASPIHQANSGTRPSGGRMQIHSADAANSSVVSAISQRLSPSTPSV